LKSIGNCCAAWIVTGFATVGGVEIIRKGIFPQSEKLKAFVVGAVTYRGFEALDKFLSDKVPKNNLFVHLGHSRKKGEAAKCPFYPAFAGEIKISVCNSMKINRIQQIRHIENNGAKKLMKLKNF